MMKIICDYWVGYEFAEERRHGDGDCDGEVAAGSQYFMINFAAEPNETHNQVVMRGGFHYCRKCMMVAVAELSCRLDISSLEVRAGKVY